MRKRNSAKEKDLNVLAEYIQGLYAKPELRQLFLELTLRCNERCVHCGSRAGECSGPEISREQYREILTKVKEEFDISKMQLCITGGEPLMRNDFFEIMNDANGLGYSWGMTSNGTLITKEKAHLLRMSGMKTISVSIDGLQPTHDRFRGIPRAYELAMQGIQNLIDEGGFQHIQVTTVVTAENIGELDELFEIMKGIDIDSWRVINMEPIGRALDHPGMILQPEDYRRLFGFIREKREEGWPVTYGCSHWLGLDYEREVRDWYWLCNAGVYTASIMANGDIGACLDIERRPETIMGNIFRDDLKEVWENRFGIFRSPLSEKNEKCRACSERKFCRGDAYHSWNYDRNEPLVCMKGILFE